MRGVYYFLTPTMEQFEQFQRQDWAGGGPLIEGPALVELRSRMDEAIARLAPGQRSEHTASLHYEDEWFRWLFLSQMLGAHAPGETDHVELAAERYSVHDPCIIQGAAPNRSQRRRCGITIKYVPTSIRLERGFRSPTGFDWANVRLYHARGSRGVLEYAN